MKKTAIISTSVILAAVLVVGFIIWKINNDKQKQELMILSSIADIQTQVNALYKDEQKIKLADHIDTDAIQRTHDLFAVYEEHELSLEASSLLEQAATDMIYIDNMFALQQDVGSLFDESGAVVDSVDTTPYKSQAEALQADKPDFANELLAKIDDADAQLEHISSATQMVDALFTSSDKSTVKASITQAEIDDVKSSIAGIQQHSAKTNLLSYVQVADVYLDEKIKAEAKAKAEAEAKAKADEEAKAKAAAAKNLTGWVPYSTGSRATLLKYLASGQVVRHNGQYWASPELVNMIANEEVVYFNDISN